MKRFYRKRITYRINLGVFAALASLILFVLKIAGLSISWWLVVTPLILMLIFPVTYMGAMFLLFLIGIISLAISGIFDDF